MAEEHRRFLNAHEVARTQAGLTYFWAAVFAVVLLVLVVRPPTLDEFAKGVLLTMIGYLGALCQQQSSYFFARQRPDTPPPGATTVTTTPASTTVTTASSPTVVETAIKPPKEGS